jgi:hypothetical protein
VILSETKENEMATKKATKKNDNGKLDQDPPIIVGGGGSVSVIFKDTGTSSPPPVGYRRFRLPNDITTIVLYDGINPGFKEIPVAGTFVVQFEV